MEAIISFLAPYKGALITGLLAIVYGLAAKYCVEGARYLLTETLELIRYLRRKGNQNRFLSRMEADDFIWDHAIDAVEHTYETMVRELKASKEDGKLTKDEAKAAAENAWETFSGEIADVDLEELQDVVGQDLKELVLSRIPIVVSMLKKEDREKPKVLGMGIEEKETSDPHVP